MLWGKLRQEGKVGREGLSREGREGLEQECRVRSRGSS